MTNNGQDLHDGLFSKSAKSKIATPSKVRKGAGRVYYESEAESLRVVQKMPVGLSLVVRSRRAAIGAVPMITLTKVNPLSQRIDSGEGECQAFQTRFARAKSRILAASLDLSLDLPRNLSSSWSHARTAMFGSQLQDRMLSFASADSTSCLCEFRSRLLCDAPCIS